MSHKGKLIVLDGLDGSGKSTQSKLLAEELQNRGEKVKLISFPDYHEPSSALVKMYLSGEFSDSPGGVGAYAASSFYAVDRYASFKKFWQKEYESGYTILATRYVSSNAIHQMGKLPESEWDGYLNWLDDFEYQKLSLPRPDKVIFLSMTRLVADRLIEERYGGDERRKDIHERDKAYLQCCQKTAEYAARVQNWRVVFCDDGERPLDIETVTRRILKEIED